MSALMLAIVMACSGKEEVVRDSGGTALLARPAPARSPIPQTLRRRRLRRCRTLVCADGLNLPLTTSPARTVDLSLARHPDPGSLGYAIDVGGDVNGDGWADLLVGAPAEDQMRDDVVVGTDSGGVHPCPIRPRRCHNTHGQPVWRDRWSLKVLQSPSFPT